MLSLLLALACGKTGEVEPPPPDTDPPEPVVEVPGNGIDDDRDGWADEYGVDGRSTRFAPKLAGGFDAVAVGEVGTTGWVAAGEQKTPDTDGRTVKVWFNLAYGKPSELVGPAGDPRFGSAVAIVGSYLAVATADDGVTLYTLPPSGAISTIPPVDAPIGDVLVAAGLGRAGGTSLLASEGEATTLLFEPSWFAPTSPGGWSGALPVGAGDTDGDGRADVLLAESLAPDVPGSAWIVDGADVAGVVPVEEAGVAVGPAGDQLWAGAPVGAGDVDGDGYDDLLVAGAGPDLRGAVHLLAGPINADSTGDDAVAVVTGTWDGEACVAAAVVGDALAVGCAGGELPGRVGAFALDELAGALAMEDAAVTWVGESIASPLGVELDGGLDLTGDLEPDLAVLGLGISVLPGPLWR